MDADDRAGLVDYKITNQQQLEAKRRIIVLIAIIRKRLQYVSRKSSFINFLDRAV
jgi:hypothetical protein